MKTQFHFGLAVLLTAVAGCASTTPPPELVNARAAYTRASGGIAAQLNPTDLHTAKESLDVAEQSFKDDSDSEATRDRAYVAERRTELAESRARIMAANQQKQQIAMQLQATQASQLQNTSAELGRTKQALAVTGEALQSEQQRRIEAEQRAAQALADLSKISNVKQETRGTVITLSGEVLFTTGKSELLPTAQSKLNEVADALTKQDKDSSMVVEGHTDSRGALAMNQELSQKRAESVRAYLVSRGIAADRITATGVGPSRPVASNNTPEGRANNRRVEIVIQPKR